MKTGKIIVCMICGITLHEKVFAKGRKKLYTPWGKWHYSARCNLKK
jgi:hypothetical protein